jgi:cytochrome c-type biogenesis protein CcmE
MKQAYIVGFLVIGLALGFTLWAFSSNMTPYVTVAAAKKSDVPVQIRGKILRDAKHTPYYDKEHNALRFWIEDPKGEQIEVVYKGGKPEAFDEAVGTAAHGMVKNGIFFSDKLIIQCPSKYDEGNNIKPGDKNVKDKYLSTQTTNSPYQTPARGESQKAKGESNPTPSAGGETQ